MTDTARSAANALDAAPSSPPGRPSSMPPADGSGRRRRRRRRDPLRSRRRERNKSIAFWLFALFAVLVVTYVGLKLNEGGPP